MRPIKLILYCAMFCLSSDPAFACEPIVPLALLFGAPIYSLLGIVILKAIGFAWIERTIPIFKSVIFIIIANIFSSIIGICLVLAAFAPIFLFVAIPVVYFISLTPSKRFIELNPTGRFAAWKPQLLAFGVAGLYFFTFVLFGISQMEIDDSPGLYWILKYLYVLIALSISIGLTTLWEEWIISKLSGTKHNYLINVLKINLAAFFIIMGYLAIGALPERLQSKDFLIQNEVRHFINKT